MPRRYDDWSQYDEWPQYISIRERRHKAERDGARLQNTSPVSIEGSRNAKTFWGKSWCENLERYSDYANRLPRGRTYVRSGCVVDLRMSSCAVTAQVSGSHLYKVTVNVAPIPKKRW